MLYPFQETCVKFALAHHYSLNCCEMGLGKTRIALEAAKRTGLRIAIFGPPFLQSVWEMESVNAGVDFSYFPYSTLHKVKPREVEGFGFWIAEECHYLKNPTANRTHAFYSLLKATVPEYFLGLTGTPITNRVPDFWTLIGFCNLNPKNTSGMKLTGDLAKYRAFSRHFCVTTQVEANGARFEKFGPLKAGMLDEFKSLLRDKYIRFRVDQVLDDLPEMTRKDVVLQGVDAPVDAELFEVFTEYMAGRKVDSEAKARSALLKVPHTVQYIRDMRANGVEFLLVFTDHIQAAQLLGEGLDAIVITGGTPSDVRQSLVKRFQAGEVKTLVSTIGSMSVGHTLTKASHVVFNDQSWKPADNLQAEKRIHRIGQRSACFAHYIHATPTDFHINRTLWEKMETINLILGVQ